MKWIKYKREIQVITQNGSCSESFLQEEMRSFSDETRDAIVEKASEIAYNGEYTIEDDGQPEPEPTEQEQLRADVDFLLAMGGVL